MTSCNYLAGLFQNEPLHRWTQGCQRLLKSYALFEHTLLPPRTVGALGDVNEGLAGSCIDSALGCNCLQQVPGWNGFKMLIFLVFLVDAAFFFWAAFAASKVLNLCTDLSIAVDKQMIRSFFFPWIGRHQSTSLRWIQLTFCLLILSIVGLVLCKKNTVLSSLSSFCIPATHRWGIPLSPPQAQCVLQRYHSQHRWPLHHGWSWPSNFNYCKSNWTHEPHWCSYR